MTGRTGASRTIDFRKGGLFWPEPEGSRQHHREAGADHDEKAGDETVIGSQHFGHGSLKDGENLAPERLRAGCVRTAVEPMALAVRDATSVRLRSSRSIPASVDA